MIEFVIKVTDAFYNEDSNCLIYLKALQEMASRMDVSHHKYGLMGLKYPEQAHAIDSARSRMWMYDGVGEPVERKPGNTGNTENCIDAANFLVIERILPSHSKAKFKAQTASASPGIVFKGEEGEEKFHYVPQEGAFSK